MNQKKKNPFKSKLSKKAKEFRPTDRANTNNQQMIQQNQQQAFSYFMNNVVENNQQIKFQNKFTRLDQYTELEKIQEQFLGLSELNMDRMQINENENLKFVVITSNSMDDIHKSIKYGIWTSPKETNELLKQLYQHKNTDDSARIILFFKVKGDVQFCGCAELISNYIEEQQYNLWWERVEWKGLFNVKWHYIKNLSLKDLVPKGVVQTPLRYFESQKEINNETGMKILKSFQSQQYNYQNSIFKMFCVMDRREDELISIRQKVKMNKMR